MPGAAGMPLEAVPAVTGALARAAARDGGRPGGAVLVAEAVGRELAQGGERLGACLGAARAQQDRVALPDRERDQGAEAAGVGRAAAGGLVGDRDRRVEAARGLDDAGRRAGVQAEAVGHLEP